MALSEHGAASPDDDAAAHLAVTPRWDEPPAELLPWLAAARALPFRESGAQERYLREVDLPAHPGEAGRAERYRAALARARALADAGQPLDWPALGEVQALLLGREVAFRQAPAFARGGALRYGWEPGLEARFRARWAEVEPCPLREGLRRYLELIHLHPFPDGNSRAARLALEHALRAGGVATPDLEALVRLPKPAGDPRRAWQALRLLCRGVLRTAGVCPGSVGAPE